MKFKPFHSMLQEVNSIPAQRNNNRTELQKMSIQEQILASIYIIYKQGCFFEQLQIQVITFLSS